MEILDELLTELCVVQYSDVWQALCQMFNFEGFDFYLNIQ